MRTDSWRSLVGGAMAGGLLLATAAGQSPAPGTASAGAARGQEGCLEWRGDRTGRFPDAQPPLEFGPDRNVIWKMTMPHWSNASPVIVGDRLFVCAELDTLMCIRLSDGMLLWQRTTNPFDLKEPSMSPEEAARERKELERHDQIDRQIQLLRDAIKAAGTVRPTTPPAEDADDAADPGDAPLPAAASDAARLAQLQAEYKTLARFHRGTKGLAIGKSCCTPVSDGKHVYVIFGDAMASCFDLDGNRKWITTVVQNPKKNTYASPVLIGDKLILCIDITVYALDKNTGETLWTAQASYKGDSMGDYRNNAPGHARVGGVDLIITPVVDVFRASDGKQLAAGIGKCNCVTVHEDVAYCGGTAFRLAITSPEVLEVTTLWKSRGAGHASPLVHDGLAYLVGISGDVTVVEAATGKGVYHQNTGLTRETYTSPTLAGEYIFIADEKGTFVVFKAGRQYQEVARMSLGEKIRSCPVFLGKRMFVRGLDTLYCFGQE